MNAATGGAGAMGAGVLRAEAASTRFGLSRHPPPDDLAPFVDFFWVVRWDLRGRPPYEQAILPHPNVNLAFEAAGAAVYGVDRKIFTRRLSGKDKALGVRFRPGGFRPFCSAPISTLNDLVVPAAQIFGPAAAQAREVVMAAASNAAMIAGAVDLLRGASPRPDPVAEQGPAARGGAARRRGSGRGLGGAGGGSRLRRPGPSDPGLHRHAGHTAVPVRLLRRYGIGGFRGFRPTPCRADSGSRAG